MRRRRRKRKSLRIGIAIVVILFALVGYITMNEKDSIVSVLNPVSESDIGDLPKATNLKDSEQKKDKNIRVLIMKNGYQGEVHEKVILSSTGKLCVKTKEDTKYISAGKQLTIRPDDKRFEAGKIEISSDKKICIEHLTRGQGTPSYEGKLELWATAEGIVIINELSVEKYLKAVVPSEMPASYELEALKAQAVCARSYAYRQMENYGYPEYKAHVNDSTDYQVYGNSSIQKETNQAVKETKGQVVYYKGEIATTYYFSTSNGYTTDMRAWGTKRNGANSYLKAVAVSGKKGDYEKNLPWYRWKANIPVQTLSNLIGLNTGKDIGTLKSVKVTKRGGGDVAIQIKAIGENGSVTVDTENKIRAAFGGSGYQIELQDGSTTDSKNLLPSAFFTIKKSGDVFVIEGGGFGHGIGMSQNGANEMAKQGKNYREILEHFYYNIEIR